MRNNKVVIIIIRVLVLNAGLFFFDAQYAFAYVDPYTGGYVFRVLFPVVAAAAAAFLFFKNKIKIAFQYIKESIGKWLKRDS